MKMTVEREYDVERIINELTIKASKKGDGNRLYDITVNRQLLADARDVLKYYYEKDKESETPVQKDDFEIIKGE